MNWPLCWRLSTTESTYHHIFLRSSWIAAWFPFTALGSFFCRSFHIQNLEDFFKTSAVLRLATKYLMKNIRRKAIKALTEAWAYTLEGHDQMVARAIADPQTEGQTSYPFVHPIHVVNLAREADVRLILPSALYFLSVYPFSDLQRADHPKLAAESRTGLPKPSSQLSYEDIGNYTLMYQHRINFILKFCRNLNGRPPSPLCRRNAHLAVVVEESCKVAFARLASRVSRSWLSRTGNLHWMSQTVKWSEGHDINLCPECKADYRNFVENVRREAWDRLPSIVGLHSWAELQESDLPS